MNDEFEPIEGRLRSYLRRRADVDTPPDLYEKTFASPPLRAAASRVPTARWIVSGAVAAVVALIVVAVAVGSRPWVPPETTANPAAAGVTPGAAPTSSGQSTMPTAIAGEFPTEIDGMRVQTVAQALELLNEGALNGRAVAVAGYFDQGYPPCPGPMEPQAPFEGFCYFVKFSDTPTSFCASPTDLMTCHYGQSLDPRPFLLETDTPEEISAVGATPVVFVGHADDARKWQCAAENREGCSRAFVVDRVAWVNGKPLAWQATTRYDIAVRMSRDDIVDAVGQQPLSAYAVEAQDISSLDPRLQYAGDDVLWLVRLIDPARPGRLDDATRPEKIIVLDDATGEVVATLDLALDPTYRPGQLSVTASHRNPKIDDSVTASYAIERLDQSPIAEGDLGGRQANNNGTTTDGPDARNVLEQGQYRLVVTLIEDAAALASCSIELGIVDTSYVAVNVDFGDNDRCWWSGLPSDQPTADYVHDRLLVNFCDSATQKAVRSFEARFGLELDYWNYATHFRVFRIPDDVDAADKRSIVAADVSVCDSQLIWIGEAPE